MKIEGSEHMKSISNFLIGFIKLILNIVSIVLIIVIVLNLLVLISSKILKNDYPTIMDYTYIIMSEDDNYLNLKNNDFLLIDTRKAYAENDIVIYSEENKTVLGKVSEIKEKNILVKTTDKELELDKKTIIGTVIKTIPKLGETLNKVLQTKSLLISIVILTITSIIQSFLTKEKKKYSQQKPDFNQMKMQ